MLLANAEHRIPQQFIGVTMEDQKKRGRCAIPDVDDAEEVGDYGIHKWKAKTVSNSELEVSDTSDPCVSQKRVGSQGKRPGSQPEKRDKRSRSEPDGAGGGPKVRKASAKPRATDKEDLPICSLQRSEGPMVPRTETPALVEDIGNAENMRALDIVAAYRIATSQDTKVGLHTKAMVSKSLASGHSEQLVLEIMNKTFEKMQVQKPVL